MSLAITHGPGGWRLPAWTGLALVGVIIAVGSCDQTIDPIVGEDRPFTVWGYLDATADTQRVRVFSISATLGVDRSGPIDAVVTTTDLDTGEEKLWVDEVVTFPNGDVGHVFWSAFTAQHDHRYRLEVARSDGAVSTAQVTIPPPVTVELVNARNAVVVPAYIHGKPPNLVDVSVVYDAITLPPANPWPPGSTTPPPVLVKVPVSYSGTEEPTDDGWRFEIRLRRDFEIVQEEFVTRCLPGDLIALRRIAFRFLAADAQWAPPNDSFDPNLLVEPGTFSNVTNGFGFFGGGYTVREEWIPTDVVLRTVGFRTQGPCALMPVNIPECQLPPEPCLGDEDG